MALLLVLTLVLGLVATRRSIAQKMGKDADVEALVARLGGHGHQRPVHHQRLRRRGACPGRERAGAGAGCTLATSWIRGCGSAGPDGTVATASLLNAYNKAIGADRLWAEGYQGRSGTVAIVDRGSAHAST